MIDRNTARNIALAKINSQPIECVILDQHTLEEDFGWVFFYQSREYVETGDDSYLLAGNSPIIVSRLDGSIGATGTARPIDYYIAKYRDQHPMPDTA